MVIIMQRAIVVLLVSIHLCSHYYYLAIIMVSFSSINHGTMLHISLLSRRSTAASSSSIAYDEGSASMASRRPFCNNNMESLGRQYGLPRLWSHPHLLSHPPVEPCIVCIVYGSKCQIILLKGNREGTLYIFSK
jgi:hypothetical protein